jgi:hypothetical protein
MKGSGLLRSAKRILAGGFFLALGSCAGQPPLAQLASACDGLASAYLTAAGYAAQGKLAPDQIQALRNLEIPAKAACSKDNPPADAAGALAVVVNAAQRVALVNAGVK